MFRLLGIALLWFGIALSARFREPEPLPKEPPFIEEDPTIVMPVQNETRKSKQQMVDVPVGMRAVGIVVLKNDGVENGTILPGTKVDLLFQNDKDSGEWGILVGDAVFLGILSCQAPQSEGDEEALRRIDMNSPVCIALTPKDAQKVTLVGQKGDIRLIAK